jgi:hypothetical protein
MAWITFVQERSISGSMEKQYETTYINGKRQTLCTQKLTDVESGT